jgi:hypothetical protein
MKKSVLTILVLVVLAFNLSACGGSTETANVAPEVVEAKANPPEEQAPAPEQPAEEAPQSADGFTFDTTYENAVTEEMQLVLGSINLQSTDLAITADQAKALIPLLTEVKTITENMMPARGEGAPEQGQAQLDQSFNEEMTQAQEQLKELYSQIKAVFSSEQLQAIADMKITRESAKTIQESLGIEMTGPQGGAPMGDGQAPQGEPPAGGPGDGGQPPADGQALADGQMMGTPPADDSGRMRGGGMMLSTELIDAIVTYLETLSAS